MNNNNSNNYNYSYNGVIKLDNIYRKKMDMCNLRRKEN